MWLGYRRSVFVKICGTTSEEDALLAVAMGADAVGFIFAPSSRQVAPIVVADIVKRLPPEILTVGVFRDEAPARVAHRQDLRLSTFLRQQFGYGRGAYRFRSRHESERHLEPPGFYAGLLRRGFSRGVLPGVLVGVAQGATVAGFVCEALARRQ